MATYNAYDAAEQVGSQILALGTAPDKVTIVPKDYGNTQPPGAKNFWVNIEQVKEKVEAETSASYIQSFVLGIWVWVATPGKLPDAANTVADKAASVRDKLMYNTLGGWAREGIWNENMTEMRYVKGGNATNARYGATFEVTVTKQATPS